MLLGGLVGGDGELYRGERKGVEGRWGLGKVMDKERE